MKTQSADAPTSLTTVSQEPSDGFKPGTVVWYVQSIHAWGRGKIVAQTTIKHQHKSGTYFTRAQIFAMTPGLDFFLTREEAIAAALLMRTKEVDKLVKRIASDAKQIKRLGEIVIE